MESVTKYVTGRFLHGIHFSGAPYLSETNSRDAHVDPVAANGRGVQGIPFCAIRHQLAPANIASRWALR